MNPFGTHLEGPEMTHVAAPRTSYPTQSAPVPPPVTNATRHLCVGAYLDADFRDRSLREVYHQGRRMIAPSYGFDLLTVLGHCLRARNLVLVRDLAILAVLLVGLLATPIGFLLAVFVLIGVYFWVAIWRLVRDAFRELRAGASVSLNRLWLRVTVLFLSSIVAYVVVTVISFVALFLQAQQPVQSLDAGGFSAPTSPLGDLTGQLGAGIVLLMLLFAIPVSVNLFTQTRLEGLKPGQVPPRPQPSPRFVDIHNQTVGNTVVFGDYSPFVGAGPVVGTWSMAQRLVRVGQPGADGQPEARREFPVAPFTAVELVEYVHSQLRALTTNPTVDGHLPGLTVEDRVFVAGTEISHLSSATAADQLGQIISYPVDPRRHYLVCQVVSWSGELVTTVHIHLALQGKALYLEQVTTALPPCRREYRIVDQVGGTGPAAYLRAITGGLASAPVAAGLAPVRLGRAVVDALINLSNGGSAPVSRGYDYGARVSVRELGMAEDGFRSHLQAQDVSKYRQVIERRLFAAVLDFLQLRGVDTTEFTQRVVSILNQTAGVINSGSGTVNVSGGTTVGSQTNGGTGGSGGGTP